MSESVTLLAQLGQAQLGQAPKSGKCHLSESVEQLTQIDAGRGQQPQEDAFNETPTMQQFNRLVATK